jgi:hypothetical protein
MSLCIRHVHSDVCGKVHVYEDFVGFVAVANTTGEMLASTILSRVAELGLDMQNCRGQGYDGASNMSGRISGVRARIERDYSQAVYVHCFSHCLNLALNAACALPAVLNMFGTVQSVCVFLGASPKRLHFFKAACESTDGESMDGD